MEPWERSSRRGGNYRADNGLAHHPPRIRARHHTLRGPRAVVADLAQLISELDNDENEANLTYDIIRYKHDARGPWDHMR
ncbi:hypothetical protein BHE74_00026513 [Ensete ventricosum]|nr:hypothetical protein BHE74_00026513 [Ensete ventricosum]RZR79821.1 hypothetical protein BHM03_00005669 [Ensete ventricosum]